MSCTLTIAHLPKPPSQHPLHLRSSLSAILEQKSVQVRRDLNHVAITNNVLTVGTRAPHVRKREVLETVIVQGRRDKTTLGDGVGGTGVNAKEANGAS
jgi:hypothetical protein